MTFTRGDTVYWAKEPKGRFVFVKVNGDGSYQIVGGEDGYSSGRDAIPEQVSVVPFEGTDQLLHFAKQEANFAVEVTVGFLAERFTLPTSTVGKFVRDNPDVVRIAMQNRGAEWDLDGLLGLDERRRKLIAQLVAALFMTSWGGVSVFGLGDLFGFGEIHLGGAPEYPYDEGRGIAYEPGLDHPLLIPSAGDARPNWTGDDGSEMR